MATRVEILLGDCENLPLAPASVDLVFGSPPYPEKTQRYGIDQKWASKAWAWWMLRITREALRICRGPVCWVVNGAVRESRYLPAVERLAVALDDDGIHLERPCIWHKNAPPNRKDWFGNDWEYVLVAKRPGSVPYFDWQAIAHPPKYTSGGHFRQRDTKGKRRCGGDYPQSELARPRDVFRVTVGGGHMGSAFAHRSEAPYPEALVAPFVLALCPPGGTMLDPFGGSGTTAKVAALNGRNAITADIRLSQCELTFQRLCQELPPGIEITRANYEKPKE